MKPFETDDIVLAAFLQARNHTLVEARLNSKGMITFVFAESEQILRDATAFLNNASIPVRTMASRMARLRDLCREVKRRRPTEQTRETKFQRQS